MIFSPQNPALDAQIYNCEGRDFYVAVEEERLSVVLLRGNFLGEHWPNLIFSGCILPIVFVDFPGKIYAMVVYFILTLAILVGMIFDFPLSRKLMRLSRAVPREATYEFNRAQNLVSIGYLKSLLLDEIVAVNAAKKSKTRFLIALQLRDGTSISLGDWRYASKETAWREDAAKLAEFLRVPLQIPPF